VTDSLLFLIIVCYTIIVPMRYKGIIIGEVIVWGETSSLL